MEEELGKEVYILDEDDVEHILKQSKDQQLKGFNAALLTMLSACWTKSRDSLTIAEDILKALLAREINELEALQIMHQLQDSADLFYKDLAAMHQIEFATYERAKLPEKEKLH